MKNILIVDDEVAVREMLKTMLSNEHSQLFTAKNGMEAENILANNTIELVITDIVMPNENGIDLIMEIKKQYPTLPVLAISGGGGIEGRFNYLEIAKLVGADSILEKPFDLHKLREVVSQLLTNKG